MKRRLSAAFALVFFAAVFVAVVPQQASATTTAPLSWPINLPDLQTVNGVVATSDTNVTVYSNGSGASDIPLSDEIRIGSDSSGATEQVTDQYTDGTNFWLTGGWGAGPDGVDYTFHNDGSMAQIVAVKDGRIKWNVTVTAPGSSMCYSHNYIVPNTSMKPAFGMNGVVYFTGYEVSSNCENYLVGLNEADGSTAFTPIDLGSDSASGPLNITPKVFAFDDKIIYTNKTGEEFVLGNDNTEITADEYQFPILSGSYTGTSYSASDGGLYLVLTSTGSTTGGPWIDYHDADGTNDSMAMTTYGYGPGVLALSGGQLVVDNGSQIARYDVPNGTTTTQSAPSQPYGNLSPTYIASDASGNLVLVEGGYGSSGHESVGVFVITTSGSATSAFQLTGDGISTNMPSAATPAIRDGEMYLPISHGQTTVGQDVWLHKIDLTSAGFGTFVPPGPTFGTDMRLQYVAMGDSYSSGEGNPDFIQGTAEDSDKCHRSLNAYPYLLANNSQNELNLVDNVACSGAKTSDITTNGNPGTGQWNEPAQLDALSSVTDAVTLTIGGNDIGFSDYIAECVVADCGNGTNAYSTIMDNIAASSFTSNLEATYSAILDAAPNAQIYVVGYPLITTEDEITCQNIDISGAYNVVSTLDSTISNAVSDVIGAHINGTRLRFIDANSSTSPFIGKNVCGPDPYFRGFDYVDNVYSYHPLANGQEAFEQLIEDFMNP